MEDFESRNPFDPDAALFGFALMIGFVAVAIWLKVLAGDDKLRLGDQFMVGIAEYIALLSGAVFLTTSLFYWLAFGM